MKAESKGTERFVFVMKDSDVTKEQKTMGISRYCPVAMVMPA